MQQCIAAVDYMHRKGFMHRDIKPENFLVTGDKVKLADFGLAKSLTEKQNMTEYVSTRWYRAPELTLLSNKYNQSVDVWALGCIMAEMYLNRPLFPGRTEHD